MLKLPKGLKKKKKGKKSKRKGEDDLFTEEELKKYRKEHQQQGCEGAEGQVKENEEWSKFKDLTTGVDSVLKKTQGDLDRIKSTSFFQRIPAGPKQVEKKEVPQKLQYKVEKFEASDFVQPEASEAVDEVDKTDYAVTDTESDEEDQDDIFDTSYVEAVERGEVKLAYVPDSPDDYQDDGLFDTSHVDAVIKGQEIKTYKGKKVLDIGVAVEVLTGRIDNVTITAKKSKRVIPGDLLLESTDSEVPAKAIVTVAEPIEKSILDLDADIPVTTPIDLSVSLHTSFIQQNKTEEVLKLQEENNTSFGDISQQDQEDDEFTLLAAESLETSSAAIKIDTEIKVEPVLEESWSAFEANKIECVFAESIIEDQIDVDPFIVDGSDPFDTSFADSVVPSLELKDIKKEAVILEEDDDDFNPRADEIKAILNNRRKSSVRIHLTDPFGIRESITSDDINEKDESSVSRDLLGGSTTDLNQLGDSPLNPVDINSEIIDPFDTTSIDKKVAPGKGELKFIEQELIGANTVYRVPSDPDFNPRAGENKKEGERRASRPENLLVGKNVVFQIEDDANVNLDIKPKSVKPLTPYYTREISITEDIDEEKEAGDDFAETLTRTRSDEDLGPKTNYQVKRRHSELPQPSHKILKFKPADIFDHTQIEIKAKVLTPSGPKQNNAKRETDPFDTSFATDIVPSRTELKLLAKEFSCEDSKDIAQFGEQQDLLDPSDDIFQAKALTPEPTNGIAFPETETDPFDTSFATDLKPGKTEIKLLESEFLN